MDYRFCGGDDVEGASYIRLEGSFPAKGTTAEFLAEMREPGNPVPQRNKRFVYTQPHRFVSDGRVLRCDFAHSKGVAMS